MFSKSLWSLTNLRTVEKPWHGSCPALKGCHTWGHTYEETLANLREAIDLYVQDLIEAGEPIPEHRDTIELPEPAVVVNA